MNKIKYLLAVLIIYPILSIGQGNFFFNQHLSLTAEVDTATYFHIIYDATGSMGSVSDSLAKMCSVYLKDTLLAYYLNDLDIYNDHVQMFGVSSERTFGVSMLDYNTSYLSVPGRKIINVVFQNEADPRYHDLNFDDTSDERTTEYNTDIASLLSNTEDYTGTLQYTGIIFEIYYATYDPDFKNFLQAVESGSGNYSGSNGLSEREDQFRFYYDLSESGTSIYYTNYLIEALRNLGYNL